MDKKLLRKTIVDLKPGDIFSIVFAGQMESQTGKYEFVSQRTGRGKGGRSKLMKAKLVDGNVEVEFGTPHSSYIASITSPDGEVRGITDVSKNPIIYDIDIDRAMIFFETMQNLIGTNGSEVLLNSEESYFDGKFTVVEAKKIRGRCKQIVLTLVPFESPEMEIKFWSRRHSGIVNKFNILTTNPHKTYQAEVIAE